MWIEVVAGEDWAAQKIAEKHGYIVDRRYLPLSTGCGFGELDPTFCVKVEKGENIIESEGISERPDLEGRDFSWLLVPMTVEWLENLKKLCDEATGGNWVATPCNVHPNSYLYGPAPVHRSPDPPGLMKCNPPHVFRPEDAAFIAAARTAMPLLIAELQRRLKEESDGRHSDVPKG